MKIEEIRNHYHIPIEKLQVFEAEGFFDHIALLDGERDFQDEDITLICKLLTLTKLGMKLDEIKEYRKEEAEGGKKKRCKLLKKHRQQLMDAIHEKQKDIDCLDYLLYEIEHALDA